MVKGLAGVVLGVWFLGGAWGAEKGAVLFSVECSQCHGVEGEGSDKLFRRAPALAGLPDFYVAAQLEQFRWQLRGAAEDGESGARNMHAMMGQMNDAMVKSVAQHIAGMRPVVSAPSVHGDVERGKILYGKLCAECHGVNAQGNAAKESPPLYVFQDWYLVRQIQKFRDGTRKPSAANADAVKMHGVAVQLVRRKQDVKDLAVFIAERLTGTGDAEP
jgi:cytochrome c553